MYQTLRLQYAAEDAAKGLSLLDQALYLWVLWNSHYTFSVSGFGDNGGMRPSRLFADLTVVQRSW